MEKLLILDANSLLNRAYYAQPLSQNDKGISTNAVYGFANILAKVKEDVNPDYILAAFDSEEPLFRHKEYFQLPVELKEQVPLIKELLNLLSINIFEIDSYEASDIIGTVAKYAEKNNVEVYIVTDDKNPCQLISEKVKVIEIEKGLSEIVVYDEERFMAEFKIKPVQFIDVKALIGVPCVGEKTAFNLISEYESTENIQSNVNKLVNKKLKESLEKSTEQIREAKKLSKIITDVDLKIDLQDLKTSNGYNDEEKLKEFLLGLDLKKLLTNLLDEEKNSEEVQTINKVDALDKFKEVLKSQEDTSYICYDVNNETKFSQIELNKIIFACDSETFEVDFNKLLEEDKIKSYNILKEYMEDDSKKKVIHDAKHLITVLAKHDIEIKSFIFDTAIAAYIVDSSKGEYKLEMLINQYLGEEIKGEKEELLIKSAPYMKKVTDILKEKIEENDMQDLYNNIELPLVTVLSYMESQGFNVDKNMLDTLEVKFKDEIERTQKEIYELAEEEFNISSPKQLGKILFEKLDLPVIKKTKTGYSTNADVLEKLRDKHPIIEKIIYYRQITKLNSTYVEGLKNVIDEDGKIHSSFNQTVTTTGRLSSTDPNLQNIPVKYEMGREIRKVFIPNEEGDILLSCDYSQIELRVLAHMADDENMIKAFTHHSDIHTKTASEVFNVPIDEVTPIMRSRAKAVNFGIVYGISDFSLAQDLKITKKEASEYMNIYFDRYPRIKLYLDEVIENAVRDGYVLTIFNRRRFIPEIKASNKIVKALGERLAMNAPIQGSAADIIKIAMVNVYNRLKKEKLKSSLILQVHDELILNVKKDEEEKVRALVKEEMEKALTLHVPLEVDVNEGATWYEAK